MDAVLEIAVAKIGLAVLLRLVRTADVPHARPAMA
jgi:hypothetical protein